MKHYKLAGAGFWHATLKTEPHYPMPLMEPRGTAFRAKTSTLITISGAVFLSHGKAFRVSSHPAEDGEPLFAVQLEEMALTAAGRFGRIEGPLDEHRDYPEPRVLGAAHLTFTGIITHVVGDLVGMEAGQRATLGLIPMPEVLRIEAQEEK